MTIEDANGVLKSFARALNRMLKNARVEQKNLCFIEREYPKVAEIAKNATLESQVKNLIDDVRDLEYGGKLWNY